MTEQIPVISDILMGFYSFKRRISLAYKAFSAFKVLDWARDRADFKSQWERMLAKRERRFRWYQKHGAVPDGWTPPDPKDPHSRKYPKRALAATLPKKYRMFWPVLLDRPDYELMVESG